MTEPLTPKTTERPGGLLDVDAATTEDIAALLEAGQRGMVLNLVAGLHPADLALLLHHIEFEEARRLFRWLPPGQSSEALAELDDDFRAALLDGLRPERLTDLLDELDTDDAADVLADLPDAVARQVLPALEDAIDVAELLAYDEETAGGLMATEVGAVPPTATMAEAVEQVRRTAQDVEEVYAVFVLDEAQRLLGVVSLKQLLLTPASLEARDVMETDVITVTTDLDQEEVARIVERYDLVSLPVIDPLGRMVGRITIDDVVDVIRSEAEEDIQIMSGVSGDESPATSVFQVSRGRLPWLLVGLFGAGLSGLVIGTFEGTLRQAVVLASFIPVITAMGGNAAVQSAAITVQGLSSGEIWTDDVFKRLGKEVVVALCNGLVLAALLMGAVVALGLEAAPRLAATLGLTMLAVVALASANGAVIPFALRRLGLDPASSMGPFVTTLNDIIGLTVYFTLATLIYL